MSLQLLDRQIPSRHKTVLPQHTWYARGDDATLIFPVEHWQGILAKRGLSPEEKGYYLLEERADGVLSMFNIIEVEGSENSDVWCRSMDSPERPNPYFRAIKKFTQHHLEMHVVPYHTHPIDGPSSGDVRTYAEIFAQTGRQIRDFITIGPSRVEVNRVYGEEPRVRNILPTKVKIMQLGAQGGQLHKQRAQQLGQEFWQLLRA